MKLNLHAVLMIALAAPAFCQSPAPEVQAAQKAIRDMQVTAQNAAREAQALAPADLADQMARASEKLAQLNGAFDTQKFAGDFAEAFSADKMAAVQEKLAQLNSDFDPARMADIESKAAAAMEKMNTFDFDSKLQDLQFKLDAKDFKIDTKDFKIDTMDLNNKIQDKLGEMQFKLDTKGFGKEFGQPFGDMAFLQAPKPTPPEPPVPPVGPMGPGPKTARVISISRAGGDGEYDQGVRALDQHHYEEAVLRFDAVVNSKSTRIDGALYWKAYALNRQGKRDEALAALAQLRRDFASSGWLNDAQALEAEVKQNGGQPISPAQESNDDLKLLAINSLMNADAERAIPLIEGILKGSGTPSVKDRALFVLAQSKSPRAQTVLSDYAKGGGNPDLQLRAIQYVSMSRSKESIQLLASVYGSSNDNRVKNQALQQLMNARAYDSLMSIAKSEKDTSLRDTAIRYLASDRSAPIDGLLEMYNSSDAQAKRSIVDGLMGRHDAKTLIDLARKESDPKMKAYIVERVGSMRDSKEAMDYMMELIKQ